MTVKNRKRTTAGHLTPVSLKPRPLTPIDVAIKRLVPCGTRRKILALFEHRCSWSAIKHWRKGRHAPPRWAKELIGKALARGAEHYTQPLEDLQATPDPIAYAPNILAYHASRMEKAGK